MARILDASSETPRGSFGALDVLSFETNFVACRARLGQGHHHAESAASDMGGGRLPGWSNSTAYRQLVSGHGAGMKQGTSC